MTSSFTYSATTNSSCASEYKVQKHSTWEGTSPTYINILCGPPFFIQSHESSQTDLVWANLIKQKKKKLLAKPITMYDQTFILKSRTQHFFLCIFPCKTNANPKVFIKTLLENWPSTWCTNVKVKLFYNFILII